MNDKEVDEEIDHKLSILRKIQNSIGVVEDMINVLMQQNPVNYYIEQKNHEFEDKRLNLTELKSRKKELENTENIIRREVGFYQNFVPAIKILAEMHSSCKQDLKHPLKLIRLCDCKVLSSHDKNNPQLISTNELLDLYLKNDMNDMEIFALIISVTSQDFFLNEFIESIYMNKDIYKQKIESLLNLWILVTPELFADKSSFLYNFLLKHIDFFSRYIEKARVQMRSTRIPTFTRIINVDNPKINQDMTICELKELVKNPFAYDNNDPIYSNENIAEAYRIIFIFLFNSITMTPYIRNQIANTNKCPEKFREISVLHNNISYFMCNYIEKLLKSGIPDERIYTSIKKFIDIRNILIDRENKQNFFGYSAFPLKQNLPHIKKILDKLDSMNPKDKLAASIRNMRDDQELESLMNNLSEHPMMEIVPNFIRYQKSCYMDCYDEAKNSFHEHKINVTAFLKAAEFFHMIYGLQRPMGPNEIDRNLLLSCLLTMTSH